VGKLQPGWLLRLCRATLDRCIWTEDELRPYQSGILIPFIIEHPKCGAYVDMGLGKTISVLTALVRLFEAGEITKVLIVAPKRVAIQTWPLEVGDWRHTCWMTYSLIRPNPDDPEVTSVGKWAYANDPLSPRNAQGAALVAEYEIQKAVAAMAPQSIHIVNREAFVWLTEFHGAHWPYDMIVVDESTGFADHSTKRWKAMSRVAQRTKRVVLLSGTPAPEGLGDLFPQLYLLDGGKRLGRSVTFFRDAYMMQERFSRVWKPQMGAVDAVTAKIADICIVMKAREYLKLTEPLVFERPILLEKGMMKAYRAFERTMILHLPDEADTVIEAKNAGVLYGKLLQFASGTVYGEDKAVHLLHSAKLEELAEIIEENPGEPLMVAYWFKPSLRRLQKAYPKATTMDKDGACVADWNAGKISMLFVHPQSAGHGLNMQLGPGHILIYFDTPQSLELYMQLIGRLARSGQRNVVKVIHIVARGTIEAWAVPKLKAKELAQDTITAKLRAMRARFRKAA
jgi:hypothetical protein